MRGGRDFQTAVPPLSLGATTKESVPPLLPEAVGKRFGGVDIANADDEWAPAIALRRHAEG